MCYDEGNWNLPTNECKENSYIFSNELHACISQGDSKLMVLHARSHSLQRVQVVLEDP